MSNTHPNPTMFTINENQSPLCFTCSAQMLLQMIAPAKTGFDLRTFKCPKCDVSESFVIAISPREDA